MRRIPGNTLMEYGFIGAILLVAALVAVLAFGGRLDGWLGGVKNNLAQTISSSEIQALARRLGPPNPGTQHYYIRLDNGQVVAIPNYPANLDQSIQTNGANGTTTQVLNSLETFINGLLESGEITEEEANRFRDLANKGREMAEVMRMPDESIANSGGNRDAFLHSTFTYNGKTYTSPRELSQELGWNYAGGGEQNDQSKLIGQFLHLRDEAQASGAMDNPGVAQIINLMVNQIANMGNGVESAVSDISNELAPSNYVWLQLFRADSENLSPDMPENLQDLSDIVHRTDGNSGTICHTGGGDYDSGGCH